MQASIGMASMECAQQRGQISSELTSGTFKDAVTSVRAPMRSTAARVISRTLGLSVTCGLLLSMERYRSTNRDGTPTQSGKGYRDPCRRRNLRTVVDYGVKMIERCTIGTLARRAGVNVETIRYYQRRG